MEYKKQAEVFQTKDYKHMGLDKKASWIFSIQSN